MLLRIIGCVLAFSTCMAFATNADINGSIMVRPRDVSANADPTDVKGYRLAFAYLPDKLIHKQLQVYFDTAFAQYSTDRNPHYRHITIFSIAPVVRFYLIEFSYFSPYIEISAGPSYMSRNRFGNQYMGIQYTFQDRGGIGVAFGKEKQYFASIQAIHYSNADINKNNDGITAPYAFMIGARLMRV